ncbi:MAG TPA: exodeoxyribonuclease III, partial [Atribacteraceae bacterium]|nr:exodeoxyribonuclease III [Atribacteraceae bacterium]
MSTWTIATFNVNSIRSRLPILTRWLAVHPVDVLCLQETKTEDALFPASVFQAMGYSAVYRGEKAYNGTAICSRTPLTDVKFGFDDGETPLSEARAIQARWNGIHILNTYVPQGKAINHPDYTGKLRFFSRIRRLLENRYQVSDHFIWVGDLNVAPTERDVTHPTNKKNHVCCHEDVRKAFQEVISWGLVDVFRKHRPDDGEFTFWDYRVKDSLERNIGWRIDHVFATPPLAEASTDCFADREPRRWERPS